MYNGGHDLSIRIDGREVSWTDSLGNIRSVYATSDRGALRVARGISNLADRKEATRQAAKS